VLLREVFALGNDIGAENVLLNDYELGAVLAGSDELLRGYVTISAAPSGLW
jgi:hypothetical protein